MERTILHVDMDAFFAQIEERENPQFRGKPIVVGADPKNGNGRGVVSTANYEARKYGIKSAMPISWAWRACPTAIFLPANGEFYAKVSEKIMAIINQYSPKIQITSLDEAYLDLSFLIPESGELAIAYRNAGELAKKLKVEILEKEKLLCTVGIGPNKMIAKMATNSVKPNGLRIILAEQVMDFLADLDIEELPWVGPKTAVVLRRLGAKKINDLRRLSKETLKKQFGIAGETIYERSFGVDEEEVVSEKEIKSIGKEHTFEKDTRDPKIIFDVFENLIKEVYRELKNYAFSFKTITVVCRFSGFETHTKAKTLKTAASDQRFLEKEAKKLLLRFLLENPKPIRLVGLRLSSFSETR